MEKDYKNRPKLAKMVYTTEINFLEIKLSRGTTFQKNYYPIRKQG